MSKKTRKKSPKPSPKKAPKKAPKKSPKSSSRKAAAVQPANAAKTRPSKTRATAAGKSRKNDIKQPGKAASGASHKAATKQLTKASSPAARTSGLTEGAAAPAFRLPRDGGDTVSLSDYAGKKLVLFFYPRADTPGCTKEAIDFTRLAADFAASNTAVLGVSGDSLKAQESFRNKHELTIPLISDEKHEMLQAYGAWGEKSMYGRTFEGILRTTVLIGADGQIIRIWRHVRVDGHADEVLAAAKAV
ncbi:peroxiredoxin Q/BCP [Bradyrhizobium lablabi]|uniref:thioredoxin-dependent peroxiredoxin n=1 Tax=Bradyrhizobium lablabi TaxID=722472 RepID=A0A1M6I6C9_9BRAD|nr:redoxin domain-containing protein [Bradyrhizobium lablabi]SHJ29981.1 peroxiredoxin Q/BCP [Bradyrhizobium lablabi]